MEQMEIVRELGSTGVLLIFLFYWHKRASARDEHTQLIVSRLCDLIEKCIPSCDEPG